MGSGLSSVVLGAPGGGGGGGPPPYSTDWETSLRTRVFTNYSTQQRPSQRVIVHVSFTLLTINDLNIKDQTMSSTGYLTLRWKDERLKWDTALDGNDYSNVKFLFSTESYVWRPALIVENSVADVKIISDVNTPMRILSTGSIEWSPMGLYVVSCESDITYYPVDSQTCFIKISSWGYTSSEIDLQMKFSTISLGFYSPNGEWDLISTVAEASAAKTRGDFSFPSLTFTVTVQRRLLFHTLNTLFPVGLMAFLIPMVFRLHSESGEKIGFSLTVLLAYAVYLTMISDSIPSTSFTPCYLSIYLVFILAISSISVLCTILVLNFNFGTDADPIPNITRIIVVSIIARMICWRQKSCRPRRKVANSTVELIQDFQSTESAEQKDDLSSETDDVTWQDLSTIMDRAFFILFSVLIALATVMFISVVFSERASS
ncbi:neuronal acetylcholine receptor subunit alpha-7-like [Saccostrea cucullata]|uniref:neuronal acetylcholine receptor subunit alpha-7-like n=1 Tax=Saccostrea cuccullata TaxID=36930 RepID=UPI002ED31859